MSSVKTREIKVLRFIEVATTIAFHSVAPIQDAAQRKSEANRIVASQRSGGRGAR